MPQTIKSHTYANGLVLVADPSESMESAAFTLLVPAGVSFDSADRLGLSVLTCEMALRGAGERNSRQFIEALENLGVNRGESVSTVHASYSAATLAKNLSPALAIYADLLLRAHLPADQLEAGRLVAIQELRAVEDEPAHKVMLNLRRRHYPDPWGRPSEGEMEALESISIDEIRRNYARMYRPNGSILGVSGRVDWNRLVDLVGGLLGEWKAVDVDTPTTGERGPREGHILHQGNQTHIGIAFDSVPYRHPDYFQASGAIGVLSGGMSSRLFSEVREKRGLCYTVYASYHTLRDRGSVVCYAGTTAERAQETLDVTMQELRRLAAGVEPRELQRLKARVKSSLVMQQESSSSRSGSVARDWYHLGRARTLDEIGQLVDDLTCDSINAYLTAHPPGDFTVLTLGSQALQVTL